MRSYLLEELLLEEPLLEKLLLEELLQKEPLLTELLPEELPLRRRWCERRGSPAKPWLAGC